MGLDIIKSLAIALILLLLFHTYSTWTSTTTIVKPSNHQIDTYKKIIGELSQQVKTQQTKLTDTERKRMESDLDDYLEEQLVSPAPLGKPVSVAFGSSTVFSSERKLSSEKPSKDTAPTISDAHVT